MSCRRQYPVEEVSCCVASWLGRAGEPDAVVGEHRVDAVVEDLNHGLG
jgi:hypothetical protein